MKKGKFLAISKMATKTKSMREKLVGDLKEAKDKKAFLTKTWNEAGVNKSSEAFEFIASVYSNGIDEMKIEKDEKKFEEALQKGVQTGSTTCMIAMGERSDDQAKAASYFNAALDKEDFRAANALGVLALKAGNITEAISKFELASSHKVERAAQNLLISRMQAAMMNLNTSLGYMQKAMSIFAAPAPAQVAEKKDE